MQVERWDVDEDGELTEEALREKLREKGYSVSTYRYPPGTSFSTHTHSVDKIDAVLAGQFKITMGGEEAILERGDWVYVPAGEEHAAEVVGDETVVSLDAAKR
ncbi:MAG: cupin domain-containing protein [Bradymonadaceae bacterium]